VVAGQDRHDAGPGAADGHDDAAGPAGHVAAADSAQVGADQPGARTQADQPGRAHPPRRGRLGIGEGEVAADLRRAVGRLRALAGQRQVRRMQLRDNMPGDEPQVRAQRPPGHAGQARRVRGEPLDYRLVQQQLRDRLQPEADRPVGEPARGPQQVFRPLPAVRAGGGHDLPGERRGLR